MKVRDSKWLVLSFLVGPGDGTWVFGKYLYLLSHLADPFDNFSPTRWGREVNRFPDDLSLTE